MSSSTPLTARYAPMGSTTAAMPSSIHNPEAIARLTPRTQTSESSRASARPKNRPQSVYLMENTQPIAAPKAAYRRAGRLQPLPSFMRRSAQYSARDSAGKQNSSALPP